MEPTECLPPSLTRHVETPPRLGAPNSGDLILSLQPSCLGGQLHWQLTYHILPCSSCILVFKSHCRNKLP